MRLVKDGRVIDERFVRLADGTPAPEDVPVIVPAERFLADAAELTARPAPTGVLWPNNRNVAELAPHLGGLVLVALVFPRFGDGRAYSQARRIRERYGFRGELRATGDVLRDQFVFLLRSGFDAFEVKKDTDAAAFAEASARYSVFYQPAGDGRLSTLHERVAGRRETHIASSPAWVS